MRIYFYSPSHFEPWDYRNPDTVGIGGSETSSIEMAIRLAARGHDVTSYSPLPADCPDREYAGVHWRDLSECDFTAPGFWMLYRCPDVVDKFDPARTDQQKWLICQDEDYHSWMEGLTEPTLARSRQDGLQRVVALCQAQAAQYRDRYPRMAKKVCVSSNGIKGELVDRVLASARRGSRNPKRILFASSPDRGLAPLLWIFDRARETVPDLELYVAYGFDNIDKIAAKVEATPEAERDPGDSRWLKWLHKIKADLQAPGITLTGRLPQPKLFELWTQCGLWVCATRFRETSCLRGDMMVNSVSYGPIAIKSLATNPEFANKTLAVHSCNSKGELAVSAARNCRLTRKDAGIIRLVVQSREYETTLFVTPDHKILTDRKPNPSRFTSMGVPFPLDDDVDHRVYVEAGKLKIGDRVRTIIHDGGHKYKPTHTSAGVVLSVEPAGAADVYCMEVEPDHNFIANGIVVHNCITSQEAQALGGIPIVLPIWAVGENVQHGTHVTDILPCTPLTARAPLNESLVACRLAHEVVRWASDPVAQERTRAQMMPWARQHFHWDRFVDQWEAWMLEESATLGVNP